MTDDRSPAGAELDFLRMAIHDLNNRVGVILATSELLQLDVGEGKAQARCKLIEQKAMEARGILMGMSSRFFE